MPISQSSSKSPLAIAKSLTEFWSPRIIAEVDESYIKVARVKGEFTWHSHPDEDELFYVLEGQLLIELETGGITLNAGEMYVVPKGVQHNPVARQECLLLLIERKTTQHTGDVVVGKTVAIEDQLYCD